MQRKFAVDYSTKRPSFSEIAINPSIFYSKISLYSASAVTPPHPTGVTYSYLSSRRSFGMRRIPSSFLRSSLLTSNPWFCCGCLFRSPRRIPPRRPTRTRDLRHRRNTYLTSLPLVSVHHHGRVTQEKSR